MVDVTVLLVAVIAVVVAAVTYVGKKYVAPVLKQQMTDEERKNLYDSVVIGVAAAEQLLKSGVIGKDEREDKVYEYLEKNGITYDKEVVSMMIKAAVLDLPKTFLGVEDQS